MDRTEVIAIVDGAVAPVAKRVDDFIETEKESRRVMATLVTRLTTVIAGDKEFKQLGLVDTVASHEKALLDIATTQAEVKASIKTVMIIGGAIVTLINVGVQLYLK